MNISRGEFLRLGLAGGLALVLPFGASACSGSRNGSTGTLLPSKAKLPEPFRVPLRVPPVLEPVRSEAGADYYQMTQKIGRVQILPGLETEVWGYDGIFPGPTVEARSGRKIVMRQRNELLVPVSTHLHGGRTPPESDGYPTDLIMPRGMKHHHSHGIHSSMKAGDLRHFKDYEYPNEQRAATLWYHDHRMDFTGPQVWRGLAGFHIVRDDEEEALPLPKGEKDIPLMICDRSFNEDGSFLYPSLDPSLLGEAGVKNEYMDGVLGDTILVNGAPWPLMEVSNTKYRFRILNASNARRYELALDPEPEEGASFVQVGSDGGLLGAPMDYRKIRIGQAERFDVIIDFSRYRVGTEVTLKNRLGEGATGDVMRFRVNRGEREESAIPGRLSDMGEFEALGESDATRTREFRFTRVGHDGRVMWGINGEPFDPERMDARPKLGSTEIWDLEVAPASHPIHLHLVHFKVLSRNGEKPLPMDAGWKDTVDLTSGEEARVLVRFDGYRGRYVFHCHNLEHEDMMMMANFEVV
jgi:FtsP/CotA-like multicopper oxidase with cupredoxin domain